MLLTWVKEPQEMLWCFFFWDTNFSGLSSNVPSTFVTYYLKNKNKITKEKTCEWTHRWILLGKKKNECRKVRGLYLFFKNCAMEVTTAIPKKKREKERQEDFSRWKNVLALSPKKHHQTILSYWILVRVFASHFKYQKKNPHTRPQQKWNHAY